MMDERKLSISISRKINLGQYESAEVFISLSGIPAFATEETIREMIGTGELAFHLVHGELINRVAEAIRSNTPIQRDRHGRPREETKQRQLNMSAFDAVDTTAEAKDEDPFSEDKSAPDQRFEKPVPKASSAISVSTAQEGPAKSDVPATPTDEFDPENWRDAPIPSADEVTPAGQYLSAFGLAVFCPENDVSFRLQASEPQIKALNTGLSAAGYKGQARHPATLAVLREMNVAPAGLTSLKELSKGEASLAIEWFKKAAPSHLHSLKEHLCSVK